VITVTTEEAQGRLVELLESVEQEPVAITRKGRPAAFVVSPQDMEELLDTRRRSEAAASFEAWFARAKEELTPAAADLTDEEINRLVHELR